MNAVALVVYVLLTASLIGAAALLLERALTRFDCPARWIWLGAMSASVWLASAAHGGAAACDVRA